GFGVVRSTASTIPERHRTVRDYPRASPRAALHQHAGRESRQATEGRAPPPPEPGLTDTPHLSNLNAMSRTCSPAHLRFGTDAILPERFRLNPLTVAQR